MRKMENQSEAYRILNLPDRASREEIDEAYASLMERFSEDNYMGSPLWDMAAEKRDQIRDAYNLLTAADTTEELPEEKAASKEVPVNQGSLPEQSVSVRVRNLLNANDPDGAEALLKTQPDLETNPELIYLRGMCAWKRGWLDEAAKFVKQAAKLEPNNAEYKAAQDKILFAPPSLNKLKESKKTRGKWVCGACGACAGECACEAICEVLCDSVCGGC
ncbi:MAG: hypothetical protein IKS05_00165 [Oscillospiraceae bacterium]|nr:hypothetical protein [Oscillospiraceae bacterium]